MLFGSEAVSCAVIWAGARCRQLRRQGRMGGGYLRQRFCRHHPPGSCSSSRTVRRENVTVQREPSGAAPTLRRNRWSPTSILSSVSKSKPAHDSPGCPQTSSSSGSRRISLGTSSHCLVWRNGYTPRLRPGSPVMPRMPNASVTGPPRGPPLAAGRDAQAARDDPGAGNHPGWVSVARISQIESGDVSTQDVLSRFITALGGTLRLIAGFGDEQTKIA
jgi:hypothetical protein